ncbi:unnamed protein product [Pleuronectes platessa]|uniref:Uncharacterized protein n=1 Tax=Pleuronectes platessa TaxID=8262 RepID=A0A9N7VDQ9_PLEPL|nr:unnamed protein product [Pleuronectes platessa]
MDEGLRVNNFFIEHRTTDRRRFKTTGPAAASYVKQFYSSARPSNIELGLQPSITALEVLLSQSLDRNKSGVGRTFVTVGHVCFDGEGALSLSASLARSLGLNLPPAPRSFNLHGRLIPHRKQALL